MQFIEDYSDERLKSWCIHCGTAISSVKANRDHVPSKSLLSKALREKGAKYDQGRGDSDGYLPQVLVCQRCNSGFSRDETYLLCVLHAVLAGSLYPDPETHPEAANVLRSNRDIVRDLKKAPGGQRLLFDDFPPFTLYPDPERVGRVILKNARGTPITKSVNLRWESLFTCPSCPFCRWLVTKERPLKPSAAASTFGQRSGVA